MDRAPRAITFDLFGTLLDLSIERDEPPLVRTLLEDAGSRASVDEVLGTWLTASLAHRAREPFRTVGEALTVGADAVRDAFALDMHPAAWTLALEDLWAARPVAPGALDVLDVLRARGIPAAIVSNVDAHVLERVLASTGLGKLVEVAICSEVARAYKPHPRPWQLALARLGVPAHEALHVGDSAREDLAGAAAAGLRCLLVRPHEDRAGLVRSMPWG